MSAGADSDLRPDPNPRASDESAPSAPVCSCRLASLGRGKLALAAGLAVAAGFLLLGWLLLFPRADKPPHENPGGASTDPRLTYAGPYQNIHPDVKYVGTQECVDCHKKEARVYFQHPMYRALIPIKELASQQPYDGDHHNPFPAFGSDLFVKRQGDRVWHQQTRKDDSGKPIYQTEIEVHYAIGSGLHGHSYLTNLDGYMFQTPISWFSMKKNIWDKSPGFQGFVLRPVRGECLFCHANRAHPMEGYGNRFQEPIFLGHGIGCERCHGPGEKHLKSPGEFQPIPGRPGSKADFTIVNPGKLDWERREAVCQQCHLEGEMRILPRGRDLYDFRPGLPLDPFFSVFVHASESGEDKKAVNHVEQMYLSVCFQKSQGPPAGPVGKYGKLGCISCHNPHEHIGPDRRVSYFRDRCLQCHRDEGVAAAEAATHVPCSEPMPGRLKENGNSCIDCHMRPYLTSDIAHAASTDHRIVRRAAAAVDPAHSGHQGMPLAVFQRGKVDRKKDKGLFRDLVLARATMGMFYDPHITGRMMNEALLDFPDDAELWEKKGLTLMMLKRHSEALAAFETALDKAPKREMTRYLSGRMAYYLNKENAVDYYREVVEMNPWMANYRADLTKLLIAKEKWAEARPHAQAWLRLDPGHVDARVTWMKMLLWEGKQAEARAEMERLEALHPPNLGDIKAWFNKQVQ
jgi:hypothetical protein